MDVRLMVKPVSVNVTHSVRTLPAEKKIREPRLAILLLDCVVVPLIIRNEGRKPSVMVFAAPVPV